MTPLRTRLSRATRSQRLGWYAFLLLGIGSVIAAAIAQSQGESPDTGNVGPWATAALIGLYLALIALVAEYGILPFFERLSAGIIATTEATAEVLDDLTRITKRSMNRLVHGRKRT